MSILKVALGALGIVGGAYAKDAIGKPIRVGRLARAYCDRVRKPLLLIRAPRAVDLIMGEPVRAEATTTLAYPLPVPDRTFGAIVVVNVLESLQHPERAMAEWSRCADKVFIVAPSWWSPGAWLDPTNRWLISPDGKAALPLWTSARGRRLLRVSDNGYGRRPWTDAPPARASQAIPLPPTAPPAFDDALDLHPSPQSQHGETSSVSPPSTMGPLPSPPGSFSNSPLALTVVTDEGAEGTDEGWESFSPFDDA
jgi:SAM-dependent methyltransferase